MFERLTRTEAYELHLRLSKAARTNHVLWDKFMNQYDFMCDIVPRSTLYASHGASGFFNAAIIRGLMATETATMSREIYELFQLSHASTSATAMVLGIYGGQL